MGSRLNCAILGLLCVLGSSLGHNVSSLRYIGCYDAWERTGGEYFTGGVVSSMNLADCNTICTFAAGERSDFVVLVKGQYCTCTYWESLEHVRVEDKYCPLDCVETGDGSCGGNFAYAAYCNGTLADCSGFVLPEIENIYDTQKKETQDIRVGVEPPVLSLNLACANCTYGCFGTLRPEFDYLPLNSPETCVQFCQREIHIFSANGDSTREPKPLAALGWAIKSQFSPLPTCACLDAYDGLDLLPMEDCALACPGDPGRICGGPDNFQVSVFLTGVPFPSGNH